MTAGIIIMVLVAAVAIRQTIALRVAHNAVLLLGDTLKYVSDELGRHETLIAAVGQGLESAHAAAVRHDVDGMLGAFREMTDQIHKAKAKALEAA